MQISKSTIAIVAIVGLAAGATGALVVTRAGRTEAAAREQGALVPAGAVVEESEGIVATPPPAPASATSARTHVAPAVSRPARPVRTTPAPARAPIPIETPAPLPATAPPAPIEAPAASPSDTPRVADAPAPPVEPRYEDLELPAQAVIGLQLETPVTSETARIEDEVVARVTRDVRVGDRVAIPAGSTAHGEVTLVERGARIRERARLGVRFTSIVLGDGTRLPIDTEPIYREGDSVRNENAAKIGGGAIGGAIIGGILGGAKGAAIGGTIGAGAGTAAVAAGGRNAATLPSGTPVTVRIERPVVVSVER
jgi:hypothetical protein